MELLSFLKFWSVGNRCHSSGSADPIEHFNRDLKKYGIEKEVKVVQTGCFGLCEVGPGCYSLS